MEEFSNAADPPTISIHNCTQTTAIVQFEPLQLHEARLHSIDVYRNERKVTGGSLLVDMEQRRIKLSGLDIGKEYSVYCVLNTSTGEYQSNTVQFSTLPIEDTKCIVAAFDGFTTGDALLSELKALIENELEGQWTSALTIDNTHLICNILPSVSSNGEFAVYDKAARLNIPIVSAEWIRKCVETRSICKTAEYYVRKPTREKQ